MNICENCEKTKARASRIIEAYKLEVELLKKELAQAGDTHQADVPLERKNDNTAT